MPVQTISTKPFDDQKPGTSGLRKKVKRFQTPHYAENFIQSIFDCLDGYEGQTLIIGGDGRFYNDIVLQILISMAAANGFGQVMIGQNGILSTPAVSHLIRHYQAFGGIILSASHNPGGPDGDFGIKFNIANGGPAPQTLTDAIYKRSKEITTYRIAKGDDIDLSKIHTTEFAGMRVEVIDPVADYANLMESLFDFDAIKRLFSNGFEMRFDAMHAVAGPYAREIFENRLGAKKGTVKNAKPLADFGGGHPDPNPVYAHEIYDNALSGTGCDFGAASDGDGDRNMIVGRGIFVSPSDSLAILAANARLAPAYKDGIKGIARSMPTSAAADRVAKKLGVESFETPTGWKFFGNLLDHDHISICGEESAGTGSDHVREKDGLWAVLLWLNILAASGKSVKAIVHDQWREYGRDYYSRHDYEGIDADVAEAFITGLRNRFDELSGQSAHGLRLERIDDFSYTDPVDGEVTSAQGIRLFFDDGSRAVFRLSGTGTVGATLRLYIEAHESDEKKQFDDPQKRLVKLLHALDALTDYRRMINRKKPDVIT